MESRDIATNQIQIQKDRKKNVYQEVESWKCLNQISHLFSAFDNSKKEHSIKFAGTQQLSDS